MLITKKIRTIFLIAGEVFFVYIILFIIFF